MTTRPERPALRARYDRRRHELAVQAARIFAERGYDQTSVQELTDAVGLAAGGLYHYFAGKEQLLILICDQLMDPLLEQATAVVQDGQPPAERLRAVVRLWVAHVVARRDHMLVFQQQRPLIEHGPEWRGVRSSRKRFSRLVQELILDVQPPGAADPAAARLLLSALLGMVNHTAQWYRRGGGLAPRQIADGYTNLILGGCGLAPSLLEAR